MALTDFGTLLAEQVKVWEKDVWKVARKRSYWEQFIGESSNSVIQRITSLKKGIGGSKAIMTLVPDPESNGTIGDETLTGNEVGMSAFDFVFEVDQQRNAVKSKGKMAEQKVIVEFRKHARDFLGYWLADIRDQLFTLKLSGIAFNKKLNGATRTFAGAFDTLTSLAFAAVRAPTSYRKYYLGAAADPTVGLGTDATAGTLRHFKYDDIVKLQAIAKDKGLKPIKGPNGKDLYHLSMHPLQLAQLKLDANFIANARYAKERGNDNPLFAGYGDAIMVDGVLIHETHYTYNTRGAAGGSKFGATGNDDGARALFMGAQAGCVADLADPSWEEGEITDYGNQQSIGVAKVHGLDKAVWKGSWEDPTNLQDFGVIVVDAKI